MENGKGGFAEPNPIRAGVPFVRRIYFARRQVSDSCFVSFV